MAADLVWAALIPVVAALGLAVAWLIECFRPIHRAREWTYERLVFGPKWGRHPWRYRAIWVMYTIMHPLTAPAAVNRNFRRYYWRRGKAAPPQQRPDQEKQPWNSPAP